MIHTKEVKVRVVPKNIETYKKLKYDVEINKDIIVSVDDLPLCSRKIVKVECDNCKNVKDIKYCNYMKVFNKKNKYYCSKCKGVSIKDGVNNKYGSGIDNVFQLKSIKNKTKKTCIEKYGVEHHLQNDDILKKQRDTNHKLYGVDYIMQNSEMLKKQQQTNLERYGNKYSFLNDEIKDNIKKTNIEKYGVEHPFKNKNVNNKTVKTKLINLFNNKYSEYNIVGVDSSYYIIHCNKCDLDFNISSQNFRNRIKYKTILCTNCNNIGHYHKSGFEIQLCDFINNNFINNIIFGDRKTINPLELDIYLPDLKLAFEFNGLYWHNELYKENNYHLNKTELCEKQGIHLIHIWEDDWIYKQDIVKSMILNKIGKTPNKIFGRKTEIKEVTDSKLVRGFLDKNHLQGFVGGKVKLGLFFDNDLVSLMTFGKRRVAMGNKSTNENEYELLRFCNKLNTNVIGGASKLFKYFINNYNPNEITTYADRSHSNGKLYETLGFKSQGKTQPNYHYIIGGVRKYRFNFRKDVLVKEGFDPNKTEHEIMIDRKIYRIYDSGNLKYSFKKI